MTDDRREAYLERVIDEALADEDAAAAAREASEETARLAAIRREELEKTAERLVGERGDAVGRAETAAREMVTAFAGILAINDDLRAAVTQLGDTDIPPLSAIEAERRLSLMLAAQLATISRSSGPTFGGLKFFWSPYPAAYPWPRNLSMKEKAHDDTDEIEPPAVQEGPDGSRLPPHGFELEGRPDTGLGSGEPVDISDIAAQP